MSKQIEYGSSDTICIGCKDLYEIETQRHTMSCKFITKHVFKITYLPVYMNLFSDDIQGQNYTNTVICKNMNNFSSLVPTRTNFSVYVLNLDTFFENYSITGHYCD